MADSTKNLNIKFNLDAKDFSADLKLTKKAVEDVVAKIEAEAKNAGNGFKGVGEEAEKSGIKIKDKLATAVVALAGAAAATTMAINFMKTAILEAANADESVAKLNNVLKMTGVYSTEASDGITSFADSLEKNSSFSAEAIQDQISLAIQMGKTVDEAKYLAQSAANLSTALGQDLGSSMTQLLGSMNGIAPRFAKMSPDLKNLSADQLKAGEMVKFFHDKAVQASTSTKTFNGVVNQLNVAMGDVTEAIGGALLEGGALQDMLVGATKAFATAAEWIKENATLVKVLAGAIVGVAAVIAGIAIAAAAPFVLAAAKISAATAAIIIAVGAISGGTAAAMIGAKKEVKSYEESVEDLVKAEEDLAFAQRQRNEYNASHMDPSIAQSKLKIAALKEEIALQKKQIELDKQKFDQENPVMMSYKGDTTLEGGVNEMMSNMTGDIKNKNAGSTVLDKTRPVEKKAGGGSGATAPTTFDPQVEQLRASQAEYEALLTSRKELQARVDQEMLTSKMGFYATASEDDRANREVFTEEEAAANEAWLENFTAQDAVRLQAMAAGVAAEGDMEKQKTLQAQYESEVRLGIMRKEQQSKDEMSKLGLATANQAITAGLSLAKKGSREHKMLMRAQILMSTYTAASQALSAPPGAPWTIPIAAMVVAQGLGNLKRVDEQKFAGGGIFNAGGTSINGDSRSARLNDREMILNMQQQANLFRTINGGGGAMGGTEILIDIKNAILNQQTSNYLDGIKLDSGLKRLDSRLLT